ncbi:Uncharacterised protein [BD1-7 clade bacterium]|uniref:CheW-like domain-containing protein n=1 Tax=BD1-7 clade bacterium TaxID=2029982 RepID=A0A5S9MUV3_9GAMM|nr:Uncharacterised protein [BD1-7 clade bacterium]CAA0084240.1 Uncharacterised protein [BD1-7 clade bacterium]
MSTTPTTVSQNTLLCQIESNILLLPDVSVAEIIDYQPVESDDDMPTWFLGLLDWRELEIPLVSLEALKDNTFFSHSSTLKIIIVNSTSHRDDFAYWGFVAAEAPKMRRLVKDQLTAGELSDSEFVRAAARMDDDTVLIPDLAAVETQIAELIC